MTAINPVEPVEGGVVNFVAPSTGASATFAPASATISGGRAKAVATANATAGQYTATATTGAGSTGFTLTNESLVVTTTADVMNDTDGVTSLREAIAFAESLTGPRTITFDPSVFGTTPQTITLTLGELKLTDAATLTIAGPGGAPERQRRRREPRLRDR